jgi:hypothetical protein
VTSILYSRGESAFAASNSILHQLGPGVFALATARTIYRYKIRFASSNQKASDTSCGVDVPLEKSTPSQGVFSFAIRPGSVEQSDNFTPGPCLRADIVAVGGDYSAPESGTKTAAFTAGTGLFGLATTPPHGYRSAVAYDSKTKTWITVGPNGTDISTDDGRNWRPLKPDPRFNELPEDDQHWNALSLPYAVGPHGRIATLRPSALQQP